MDINLGISDADRERIAAGLSNLLADSYTLYLKTHIAAEAAEADGADVVRMEIGQPAAPAPKRALEAAAAALASGDPLGYTVARGLPSLRPRRHRGWRCVLPVS